MMSSSGMGSYTALRDAFSSRGGRNMVSNFYWSSTERDASLAWGHNFKRGDWLNYDKTITNYVRSVLAF